MNETITGPVTAADVENEWAIGRVFEDRWGLRWRADIPIRGSRTGTQGWQCRSVGLRIFRTHEEMAERGPLKFIRSDRPFTGEGSFSDRQAGEAGDASVAVDGTSAEDDSDS